MEAISEEYRRDPGYIWQSINLGMRMSYLMKNILYISTETYNGVPFFFFCSLQVLDSSFLKA